MATRSDVGIAASPSVTRVVRAIEKYRTGDEEAFQTLELLVLPSIMAYCYKNKLYVESYTQDDMKQIARISLLTAVRQWDEGRGVALVTLAIAIFRNTIHDLILRGSKRPTPEALDNIDIEVLDDTALATFQNTVIMDYIRTILSERQFFIWQQILLLNISYYEVAVQLGITTKQVDNALQRVKSILRQDKKLSEWFQEKTFLY